jgi:hypothetical protein
MSTPTIDDAAKVFADPMAYTDDAKLHAALSHLRAHAPVSWVDVPNYRPFWAITKHPTSWRSSAPTRCSPTRRVQC